MEHEIDREIRKEMEGDVFAISVRSLVELYDRTGDDQLSHSINPKRLAAHDFNAI